MKRAFSLSLALLTLVDCGTATNVETLASGKLRCSVDGLCFTSVHDEILSGAYRRGDMELEFDIAYCPSLVVRLNGGSDYCGRAVIEGSHQYTLTDNSNCPPIWYRMGHSITDLQRLDAYQAFSHEAQAALEAAQPEGSNGAWKKLLAMFRMMNEPGKEPDPMQNDVPRIPYDGNFLLDYQKQQKDTLLLAATQVKIENGEAQQSAALSSSTGGKYKPSFRHMLAGYEFQQEVKLWSQPVQSFLFFGGDTKQHHSGSASKIYTRRSGSNDRWRLYDRVIAGNHGAEPGEERMQPYATCEKLPITQGYYAAGGECEGGWLFEHLCNDDTAYQIWHAYGGWNGGHHCLGKRRPNRPWCELPW